MTAGLDTEAVRMPKNETARALIAAAGVAIAAPSANTSGKPSPTKAVHVLNDMDGHIDMIIDGGSCAVGIESTVIDVTHGAPVILRPGGITAEMIEEALGCEAGNGYTHIAKNEAPRAPGMKYRHYAPNARLYIAKTDTDDERLTAPERMMHMAAASAAAGQKVAIIVTEQDRTVFEGQFDCICAGNEERPETIAQTIFDIFRQADTENYDELYMRSIGHVGIGEAVMNRIMKAAAGVI